MDGTGAQDGRGNEADTGRQIPHTSHSFVEAKKVDAPEQNRIVIPRAEEGWARSK